MEWNTHLLKIICYWHTWTIGRHAPRHTIEKGGPMPHANVTVWRRHRHSPWARSRGCTVQIKQMTLKKWTRGAYIANRWSGRRNSTSAPPQCAALRQHRCRCLCGGDGKTPGCHCDALPRRRPPEQTFLSNGSQTHCGRKTNW